MDTVKRTLGVHRKILGSSGNLSNKANLSNSPTFSSNRAVLIEEEGISPVFVLEEEVDGIVEVAEEKNNS